MLLSVDVTIVLAALVLSVLWLSDKRGRGGGIVVVCLESSFHYSEGALCLITEQCFSLV